MLQIFRFSNFIDHIAKFVVEIKGYTVDDKDMVCVNLKVDFMKKMSTKMW